MEFIQTKQIKKVKDGFYQVNSIISAYNTATKDARVYMETERLNEQAIIAHLETCFAGSVIVDSFGENWETGSQNALASVRECGSKEDFKLVAAGMPPSAGSPTVHNFIPRTHDRPGSAGTAGMC
jgi:hypothetical protein